MRPAAVAIVLLTGGACLWSSDFIVRRLLMWLVTVMALGS